MYLRTPLVSFEHSELTAFGSACNTHATLVNGDDDDNDGGIESGIKGKEGNQIGVNREGAEKIKKKNQGKHEGADSPSLPSVSLLIRGLDDERISDGKDEGTRGRRERSDVCDAIITSFVLLCQSRPLEEEEGMEGGGREK